MRAGIIGCGFIGGEIAEYLDNNNEFKLVALNDVDKIKVDSLAKKLKNNNPRFASCSELIKECDLIIEAATKKAISDILSDKNLDRKGKKLLIMSTGGLTSNLDLLKKIKDCEILLPSGAIAGLDAIKAVSGKISSLTLTTTKPVKGLEGAPYIVSNSISMEEIKGKKVIFEGGLMDAINGFPQNINVAATLHLASRFDNMKIKVVADSETKFNTHEIEAQGDFGIIGIKTQNLPSNKNPKTSYLAVLSAIQAIKNLKNNVKVGN